MNYVACLKFGNKYSAEYVNKLYSMVKRNLTIPFEFVCFTENPEGINSEIIIKELPISPKITGWWYKPFFFNPNLDIKGTILFLDLDVIVFRNIDNLFTHNLGKFLIIRDFNRHVIKNYDKFNSSVFRLTTGQHANVYADFIKDPALVTRRFHGDQDWIRHCIKSNYEYWPDEWVQSYKWEMRGKPKLVRDKTGKRNFAEPGVPNVLPKTSVAVFHGEPNPHDCADQWVIDNWK
jgi:hypothetical protein